MVFSVRLNGTAFQQIMNKVKQLILSQKEKIKVKKQTEETIVKKKQKAEETVESLNKVMKRIRMI